MTTSSFESPLGRDSGFVGSDGSLKGHLKDEQIKENRGGSDGWESVSFKSENKRFMSSLREPDDTITESCNGERPASRSSGSIVYRLVLCVVRSYVHLSTPMHSTRAVCTYVRTPICVMFHLFVL